MGLFDRFLKWKKDEKVEEIKHVQEHAEIVEDTEVLTRVENDAPVYEPKVESLLEKTIESVDVTETDSVEVIEKQSDVVENDVPVYEQTIESSLEKTIETIDVIETDSVEVIEKQNDVAVNVENAVEKKEMEASISTYEKAMEKPRKTLLSGISGLMSRFNKVDEEYFEELEDILIMADIGLPTVQYLIEQLETVARRQNNTTPETLTPILIEEMERIYLTNIQDTTSDIQLQPNDLSVMLFIGVNGAGKTTTIAKMAYKLKQEGKKVLVAAGDTFRAGAVDQLAVWANRVDVDIVKSHTGGDAAAIIFDGIKKAKAENYDVLLCDTAGRLQNKVNLMNELDKIYRIIQREIPNAPHETLLVIDGTTGQNGLSQAKEFAKVARITGTVVTKLDGSAKGGIVLAIAHELHIPVKLVGLGEKPELLAQFEIDKYLYGLFSDLIKE